MTSSGTSLEAVRASRWPAGPRLVDFDPWGIIPREGSAESAVACSGVRTVLSMFSSTKANPTPEMTPRTSAKARLRGILGSLGEVGTRAASMMRKLLERNPAVTPASFSFSSNPS